MKRAAAIAAWASCLAIFAVGVAINLPWLAAENSRLETWKIPIIWLSEATAFILFLEYGIRHVVGSQANNIGQALTLKAFIIGTIFDCGLSAYSMLDEDAAHSRAVRAQATVVSGRERLQSSGHKRYTFNCVFRDQTGSSQTAWFSHVNEHVPAHVRTAIVRRQLPVNAILDYDPAWPARSWLADVPYSHDNRLFIYSLFTTIVSVLFAAALAFFRRHVQWLPSPRVAPFIGAMWTLCMAAILQGGW